MTYAPKTRSQGAGLNPTSRDDALWNVRGVGFDNTFGCPKTCTERMFFIDGEGNRNYEASPEMIREGAQQLMNQVAALASHLNEPIQFEYWTAKAQLAPDEGPLCKANFRSRESAVLGMELALAHRLEYVKRFMTIKKGSEIKVERTEFYDGELLAQIVWLEEHRTNRESFSVKLEKTVLVLL